MVLICSGMESTRKGHINESHHAGHTTVTATSDAYSARSGSPPHYQPPQQQHRSGSTVTAEQQLQYLQHLAGVSSLKRQSPERSQHHHTATMNLGARFDQHMLEQPPPVPHHAQATGRAHTQNADLSRTHPAVHTVMQPHAGLHGPYNENVRSFIEHEEANLDRDVVIESLQALQGLHSMHPPSHTHPATQAPPPAQTVQDRPPRWRSPPTQHHKSHIVNSVLRNSFSDFDSTRSFTGASAEYSGYVTQSSGCSQYGAGGGPVSKRDAPRCASYASMSDSELEHPDRRHRSDSQLSEHSTVSFIRQKVLDSGHAPVTSIGRSRSTSAGGSDANHSGIAQSARSSYVPSAHGHSAGIASSMSEASTSSAVNKVHVSHSSAAARSSGGKMPLNRLQALYDKVTNKTT